MDIVLGYGTHPDPAGELALLIGKARNIAEKEGRPLAVVVSYSGTEGDLQDLDRQRKGFEESGAIIAESNTATSSLDAVVIHLHSST